MEYNKNYFSKINDKKVLHKVKKHWVTVSVALLGMIGGGAAVADNANASTTVKNDNQSNYQLSNRTQQPSALQKVQGQTKNALAQRINHLNVSQMVGHGVASHPVASQSAEATPSVHQTTDSSISQARTYLHNNEAKSSRSFTGLSNYDGKTFLTAGSWYQPKMIHVNGQTWRPNNSGNLRPILMNWWPDARTQYQYLTYMKNSGYLPVDYDLTGLSEDQLLAADDQVQDNLERRIYQQGNTDDIKNLFNDFIHTMPQWNQDSEDPEDDGLQGGYLEFKNNSLTPNANTPYREIGRSGNMSDRLKNNHNVMEFLLGNDIDNSNPVVQAEDLNNIYYINNVGTLHGHPNADFDGFREDATGSMDYDVTDILNQYLSDKYHTRNNDNNADAHLNILEDGSNWIQDLNSRNNHRGALTQDENSYNAIAGDLIAAPGKRAGLGCLIYNDGSMGKDGKYIPITHFQRDNDYTEQSTWEPNFSRINVHDNGAFLNAVKGIAETDTPNFDQLSASDQFKALIKADAIYNQHETDTQKLNINGNQQYYNVPSAYAWLLTNKDTVPEVYYGDLFDTSKPYMSAPNVYYNAIKTLLQDRKKYVSGGQQMRMYGTDGQVGSPSAWNSQGILTSVRFGKIGNQPIYGPDDWSRSSNNPTTGMAVVIGEDPHFTATHSINVYMGAAHKNQTYQPSLLSVANGIDINDPNPALRLRTDANGYLNIPAKYLDGVSNPQVSGSLSVWVPVGAPKDQDARTLQAASTPQDGNVYHSNATLDSHVLYESFSPFMPTPANQQQSLDYVVAHNVPNTDVKTANWLQDLGITDFRFPPHYTPVQNDNSFIDAVDQNGYAFEDRYDLGNSRATKYGNFDDLLKANEALHAASNHNDPVHTLADLVLNQVYDLPKSEPVGVDRVNTNTNGKQDPLSNVKNVLYDDKTVSDPNEMQAQYGGKYLSYLQSKYPDLFQTNEISTAHPIDPRTAIKQWSAKYMNGSNIQGRGTDYILHQQMDSGDPTGDDYYTVGNNVPNVFMSGQPENPEDDSQPQSMGIDQQRSEANSVTAQVSYNDRSANATGQPMSSFGSIDDNNNLVNLANQEIAKNPSGNVKKQIQMASSAASLQSDLANSLRSANPTLNSSEAFQKAQSALNGSQALSTVANRYRTWSSEASSITAQVSYNDNSANATGHPMLSFGSIDDNNNLINNLNKILANDPSAAANSASMTSVISQANWASEASSITARVNSNDSSASATGHTLSSFGNVDDNNNLINSMNSVLAKDPNATTNSANMSNMISQVNSSADRNSSVNDQAASSNRNVATSVISAARSAQNKATGMMSSANSTIGELESLRDQVASFSDSAVKNSLDSDLNQANDNSQVISDNISGISSIVNNADNDDQQINAEVSQVNSDDHIYDLADASLVMNSLTAAVSDLQNDNTLIQSDLTNVSSASQDTRKIMSQAQSQVSDVEGSTGNHNNQIANGNHSTADNILATVRSAQSKATSMMNNTSCIINQLNDLKDQTSNKGFDESWNRANEDFRTVSNNANDISSAASQANGDDQQIGSEASEVISDDHAHKFANASGVINSLASAVSNLQGISTLAQSDLVNVSSASQDTNRMMSQAQSQIYSAEESASNSNDQIVNDDRNAADSIAGDVHVAQSKAMIMMNNTSTVVNDLKSLRNQAALFSNRAVDNDLDSDWNQADNDFQMISNDANGMSSAVSWANSDDQQIGSEANAVISDDHNYNLSGASAMMNSLTAANSDIRSADALAQDDLSDASSASQNAGQIMSQAQSQAHDVNEYTDASSDAKQANSAAHDTQMLAASTASLETQTISDWTQFASLSTSISQYGNSSADLTANSYDEIASQADQDVESDNYNVSLGNSNAAQAASQATSAVSAARVALAAGDSMQFDINARLAATYRNTALSNSASAASYAQAAETGAKQIASADNNEGQLLQSLSLSASANHHNSSNHSGSNSNPANHHGSSGNPVIPNSNPVIPTPNSSHGSNSSSNNANHYPLPNSAPNSSSDNQPQPANSSANNSNGSDSVNSDNSSSASNSDQNSTSNGSNGSEASNASNHNSQSAGSNNQTNRQPSSEADSDSGEDDQPNSSAGAGNDSPNADQDNSNAGSTEAAASSNTNDSAANNSNRLPQTGENHRAEQLGAMILALSAILMSAGIAVDRRRQN